MTPESGEASPTEGSLVKVIMGKYSLGRLLGRGASGKVYYAKDVHTGKAVAVKVIPKSSIAEGTRRRQAMAEVSIMRQLRHPNVTGILEVLASRSRVYFVMDLLRGGDLFSRLESSPGHRFTEEKARRYFRQLISGVAHCHSHGVFHRDLKLENLLLDEDDVLKVSDFGLGALNGGDSSSDNVLRTVCGTPAYVAPEILAKKGYAGASADVWSCGVILFVLVAGYLPFNDVNLMNLYRKIYRGDYRCPKWFSPELKKLVFQLLDTDPKTRITLDGITHDPWFKKGLSDEELAGLRYYSYSESLMKVEERELNAFDLISFSWGMEFAGFVSPGRDRRCLVSRSTVGRILSRAEGAAMEEGLGVRSNVGKNGIAGVVVVEERCGSFVACVRARRVGSDLVMIEVETATREDGDRRPPISSDFWVERLRT